ncbi:hypothetical protein CBL_05201 [Carabus blaptoides fortunei]
MRRNNDSLTLYQSTYAEELLKNMEMDQVKGAATPLDPGMKYSQATEETEGNEELTYKNRQTISGLFYLAGGPRPDLAHATAYVKQFKNKPSKEHWVGERTTNDKIDRRSFSGYVIMLTGTVISWSCKKQRTTTLSMIEAEYLAM